MTGLAAATVEPIVELGPGAVVLAGVGAASAAALAVAAAVRLGAPALAAWRRPKRLRGSGSSASDGDPDLREFAAALAARFARLEERLNAATALAAPPGRVESGLGSDPGREALARAVQRIEQEQRAVLARLDAEAEKAERRSRIQLDALSQTVLPRVAHLGEDISRLRRALAERDARLLDFEGQVFDILRARDAERTLRQIDSEASDLFDKLFYADVRSHDTAEAWRADYAEWRSRIKGFWDVVRGYRTNVDQPFAVAESDIDHAGGVPDTALFGTPDMRRRFKMLVLVNERHIKFREDAFLFNAKKGSPPDPGARPQPEARKDRLAAE